MNNEEMVRRFTYHPPKPGQPKIYEEIRSQARVFAAAVAGLAPEGREKALAITKIEEAVFWANAAVARG